MKTKILMSVIIAIMLCSCKNGYNVSVYYENQTEWDLDVVVYYYNYDDRGEKITGVWDFELPRHSSLPIYGKDVIEAAARSVMPVSTPVDIDNWRCEYGLIDSVIMTNKYGRIELKCAIPDKTYPLAGYETYEITQEDFKKTYTIKLTNKICHESKEQWYEKEEGRWVNFSETVNYENNTSQDLNVAIHFYNYDTDHTGIWEFEIPKDSSKSIYNKSVSYYYDPNSDIMTDQPVRFPPVDIEDWRCDSGNISSVIMTDKDGNEILKTRLPFETYPLIGEYNYERTDVESNHIYTMNLTDEICHTSLGLCPCSAGDSAITVTNTVGKIYTPTDDHTYYIPFENVWIFIGDDGSKYLLGDMPRSYLDSFLDNEWQFRRSKYIISGTGTTINSDDEQLKQYKGCLTVYTITKQ